jgi:hypothetical protein
METTQASYEVATDRDGRVVFLSGGKFPCRHGPEEKPGQWLRVAQELDSGDVVYCPHCQAAGKVQIPMRPKG